MQAIVLVWFAVLSTAFGGVDPEGPLWIKNGKLCLDVYGGRTQEGTSIDVYTCDYKVLGQQWYFAPGTFKLVSALDQTKCVDGKDMKEGTQLLLEDCDIMPSQMWGFSTKDSTIYLESQAEQQQTTMCIDITNANYNDGTKVQLYHCDGLANQQWQMATPMPPPKPFTITVDQGGGKTTCLDLKGQNTANGTPIDVWECGQGVKGQQWYFAPGTYKLQSLVDPNKCIDASNMQFRTQLTIQDCKDVAQQTWGYNDKTKEIFLGNDVKSATLCMCLTAFDNGSPIQLFTCNGQGTEAWTITEVSDAELASTSDKLQIV